MKTYTNPNILALSTMSVANTYPANLGSIIPAPPNPKGVDHCDREGRAMFYRCHEDGVEYRDVKSGDPLEFLVYVVHGNFECQCDSIMPFCGGAAKYFAQFREGMKLRANQDLTIDSGGYFIEATDPATVIARTCIDQKPVTIQCDGACFRVKFVDSPTASAGVTLPLVLSGGQKFAKSGEAFERIIETVPDDMSQLVDARVVSQFDSDGPVDLKIKDADGIVISEINTILVAGIPVEFPVPAPVSTTQSSGEPNVLMLCSNGPAPSLIVNTLYAE